MTTRSKLLVIAVSLAAAGVRADDGAASIAAGGLVAMDRETRVVMAKEVLQISASKVIVDYDFRNDSDKDITTEVAFPIPDYDLSMEERKPSQQGFDDFRLLVDGSLKPFQVEVRAFHKGKDYTQLLNSMHVDIATFGHATANDDAPDIASLGPANRRRLKELGLTEQGYDSALWQVRKKYYWKQTFPARGKVHIRHEYSPVLGSTNSIRYGMGNPPAPDQAKELKSLCIDSHLHESLKRIVDSKDKDAPYSYVDFILTTANTWKTPIEDFTLIVERPHYRGSLADYISFCWDGPVTEIDDDHFSAHTTNLIPSRELRIGFFDVWKSMP